MNVSNHQRILWVKWLICFGFTAGLIITKPLWLADRLYPFTPVFTWVPILTPPYDQLLYYSLFIMLAAIAFIRTPLRWIAAFLVAVGYLAITDQSRWHPWFCWYSFMMLALAYTYYDPKNEEKQLSALNVCRVILIASYIWSGLQKINLLFYDNLFPWVLSGLIDSPATHPFWSKVPFAIPIIEASIGFFLLIPRYRKIGLAMAVAMHLTILTFLGPLGHSVNVIIWPWNLVLLLMVITLFARTPGVGTQKILRPVSAIHAVVVVIFLIMPAFTFVDRWDSFPGCSLYSGAIRAAYIQLDDASKRKLPERLQSYVDNQNQLVAFQWTLKEFDQPPYPEPRIYRSLLTYICGYMTDAQDNVELVVLSKPDRLTAARHTEFTSHCTSKNESHN